MNTYENAREIGFDNINVDLMLGLPHQTLDMLKSSLNKVIKLEPKHISIYSLILEEGTKLERMVSHGDMKMIDEELEREMYWETKKILEAEGYVHYEISNFAKPKFMSRHNLSCWEQNEYIGFGVAAHSYIDKKRYSNTENLEEYINNIKVKEFGKNKIIHEIQNKGDMRKRVYASRTKKDTRSECSRV